MSLATIRNLDYTILLCADVEETKRFYRDVLGFDVYRDWGTWVEFHVGATLLTLRERGRDYDGEIPAGAAGVQLAFRVAPDEVDTCATELEAAGVEILDPPTSHDYGHRTLFFADPEGNVLEIYADI